MPRQPQESQDVVAPRTAIADAARRTLGLVLLALVVLPVFRLLDPSDFLEGRMAQSGEINWRYTWGLAQGWWPGVAIAVAAVAATLTRGRFVDGLSRLGAAIRRPPTPMFASVVAVLGLVLTLLVAMRVFDQRTILNDASVQLIQARYFAAGMLAGPVLAFPEFWSIQFMVHTAAGWVSQYPPGHALLLAGGFRAGSPLIPMALSVALTAGLLVLVLRRLMPNREATARLAALLVATSPFVLGLAAGYMSHVTLAAASVAALYLALRAEDGSLAWSIASGAAVGLMVTIRPVTGIVLGILLTALVWLTAPGAGLRDPDRRRVLLHRIGWWVVGGLPFALGFGWFNHRFFGGPLTLGYVAASGPNHGLGFHEDPWGRMYTATAAVGHSSSELLSLSRELLGTPFPLVALVGVFLLLAPRLDRGVRLVLAWALLPLLVSALYWHHDLVFGPRMLGEAAPAWVVLATLAAVWLVARVRGEGPENGGAAPSGRRFASEWLAFTLVAALAYGAVEGGPDRLRLRGGAVGAYPDIEENRPTLVFVHEAWGDRQGARLAARGMRLDSIRAFLTDYDPCRVEAALRGISLEEAPPICRREQASDALIQRFGGLGLTSLLWLGDLPGLPAEGVLWVQDMGPERNADLLAEQSNRHPLFILPTARGEWEAVPYEQGLNTLWSPALAPPEE
jgi:hypothetical protein